MLVRRMTAPKSERSARVLLEDDNRYILQWETDFLAEQAPIHVVGAAVSGSESIELTGALRPDLVLMDLAVPGMSGVGAARRTKAEARSPWVVIVSLNDLPQHRAAAAARADGYVAKAELTRRLIERLFADDG